jgi:molybdopterin-guanine dinucleotide biosynthesis protein A
MKSKQLLGVVVCGGESRRMGSDKGLLPIGDTIWAKQISAKLEKLNFPVVYSINASQEKGYSRYINRDQLVVDSAMPSGPLNGLLTVYQQFPASDFLVLACDMLDIQEDTLKMLHIAYVEEDFHFYSYREKGFYQTFCAIYTGKGLNAFYSLSNTGRIDQSSLQSILQAGYTRKLEVIQTSSFNNYNRMDVLPSLDPSV